MEQLRSATERCDRLSVLAREDLHAVVGTDDDVPSEEAVIEPVVRQAVGPETAPGRRVDASKLARPFVLVGRDVHERVAIGRELTLEVARGLVARLAGVEP